MKRYCLTAALLISALLGVMGLLVLGGCETYLAAGNAGYDRFVANARTINDKQADIARDYAGSIANRVIWEMDAQDQCIWESFVMRKNVSDCGNPGGGRLTVDEVLRLQGHQ